jgi:hypothetical protein
VCLSICFLLCCICLFCETLLQFALFCIDNVQMIMSAVFQFHNLHSSFMLLSLIFILIFRNQAFIFCLRAARVYANVFISRFFVNPQIWSCFLTLFEIYDIFYFVLVVVPIVVLIFVVCCAPFLCVYLLYSSYYIISKHFTFIIANLYLHTIYKPNVYACQTFIAYTVVLLSLFYFLALQHHSAISFNCVYVV